MEGWEVDQTSTSTWKRTKTKKPPGLDRRASAVSRDTKMWEWEFATLSFPVADIWRSNPSGSGCRLPDAVLHGKRSLRPRSRAGNVVPRIPYRVRLLGPARKCLRHFSADPGLGRPTGIGCRATTLVGEGRPPLVAERLPAPTGLTSYLSSHFVPVARRSPFGRLLEVEDSGFARPLALPSGDSSFSRLGVESETFW